ncbi:MAG: ABC transporter permease [bacterium]|nr:ABC transporter permease [bacterium]
MNVRRFMAVLRKEFIHILRDPRSLAVVFLWPVSMVFLYGYAITFDIREIPLGLLDQDRTAASRALARDLTASGYFRTAEILENRGDLSAGLMRGSFKAGLVIPPGYGRSSGRDGDTHVQFIVDGSNANTAQVAVNYLRMFCAVQTLAPGDAERNAGIGALPVSVQPRVWYNPDLKSSHFIVPGLVAVVMMMICVLLTSITLVRERETGTLEQILVSPIRPAELVAGKLVPYILIALLDSALVVLFSIAVFGVPFRGNAAFLLAAALVYVFCALSLGLLISGRAKSQMVAMMASQVLTFLPSLLLSGFMFPIASLPKPLRALSSFVPATYFLKIIRHVMLKGTETAALREPFLFLLAFGLVVTMAGIRQFKLRLED